MVLLDMAFGRVVKIPRLHICVVKFHHYFLYWLLQIFIALIANSCLIGIGGVISLSGCVLPELSKDLDLSIDQVAQFGKD